MNVFLAGYTNIANYCLLNIFIMGSLYIQLFLFVIDWWGNLSLKLLSILPLNVFAMSEIVFLYVLSVPTESTKELCAWTLS